MTMKPCKFTFDDTPAFDGFAEGTTWNGFDNVCVTPAEFARICEYFRAEYGDAYDEAMGEGWTELAPGADGLISLGYGYATQIFDVDKKLARTGRS